MRFRRRFRGYCPPTSRKTAEVAVVEDDYTCTMNSLSLNSFDTRTLSFVKAKQMYGGPLLSFDYEEDSIEECEVSTNPELKLGLQKLRDSATTADGAFDRTGLSIDVLSQQDMPVGIHDSKSSSFDLDSSVDMLIQDDDVGDRTSEVKDKAPGSRSAIDSSPAGGGDPKDNPSRSSFLAFRLNYMLVTVAIMLADGLQGTHLYVLYEGYGYSVASLYCLGFLTGAVTSPITGPLVDRVGRKKAALIYCALEVFINMLEQYPFIAGLIASRMIGGVTTNLLSSVFETWLDTEYRRRGFKQDEYELVMRDSIVVSNLAAIVSGYLAHELAERMGPVGPFKGAVTCTAVAFAVVAVVWTENYGSEDPGGKSVINYLSDAVKTFRNDSRALRVGIIQGLTCSSIQIFIFLWSPVVREFAQYAPKGTLGLDSAGEPAYGLLFGAFMAAGVLGGVASPLVRKLFTALLAPLTNTRVPAEKSDERPMAVELLAATCYMFCAALLFTPCVVRTQSPSAFSTTVGAFLIYEFIIGVYMPCEGVIRSIYIPSDARCSLMTLPRVIVNVSVSLGVISTQLVSNTTAHAVISVLMIIAGVIQLSLISSKDWQSLSGRTERFHNQLRRSLSLRSQKSNELETKKQC